MAMDDLRISDMKVTPLVESAFIRPMSIAFNQNGRQRKWDFIKVQESVVIIIFNISQKALVLVKQFRPAVYYCSVPEDEKKDGAIDTCKYPVSLGVTLEFCAGIVDKKLPVEEIAREEVLEECGYNVPVECLKKIKTLRAGIASEGALQTFFYVEVTDQMKVSKGGGLVDEGEVIEVVEMSIPEARKYVDQVDNLCPGGFLFGLLWFLQNKADEFK